MLERLTGSEEMNIKDFSLERAEEEDLTAQEWRDEIDDLKKWHPVTNAFSRIAGDLRITDPVRFDRDMADFVLNKKELERQFVDLFSQNDKERISTAFFLSQLKIAYPGFVNHLLNDHPEWWQTLMGENNNSSLTYLRAMKVLDPVRYEEAKFPQGEELLSSLDGNEGQFRTNNLASLRIISEEQFQNAVTPQDIEYERTLLENAREQNVHQSIAQHAAQLKILTVKSLEVTSQGLRLEQDQTGSPSPLPEERSF